MSSSPTADDLGGRSVSIELPSDALVLLVGIAGSGKSTFASRHFSPTQVLSSDALRALVADDSAAQGATEDAFDLLHRVLEMRLRRARLTVVDATNVQDWARAGLLDAARRHRRPAVAIVFDLPLEIALARNAERPSPRPPPAALKRQHRTLQESLPSLAREGFAAVRVLSSVAEVDSARIVGRAPTFVPPRD